MTAMSSYDAYIPSYVTSLCTLDLPPHPGTTRIPTILVRNPETNLYSATSRILGFRGVRFATYEPPNGESRNIIDSKVGSGNVGMSSRRVYHTRIIILYTNQAPSQSNQTKTDQSEAQSRLVDERGHPPQVPFPQTPPVMS